MFFGFASVEFQSQVNYMLALRSECVDGREGDVVIVACRHVADRWIIYADEELFIIVQKEQT